MTKKGLLEIIENAPDDAQIFINGEDAVKVVLKEEYNMTCMALSKSEIFILSKNQSR